MLSYLILNRENPTILVEIKIWAFSRFLRKGGFRARNTIKIGVSCDVIMFCKRTRKYQIIWPQQKLYFKFPPFFKPWCRQILQNGFFSMFGVSAICVYMPVTSLGGPQKCPKHSWIGWKTSLTYPLGPGIKQTWRRVKNPKKNSDKRSFSTLCRVLFVLTGTGTPF